MARVWLMFDAHATDGRVWCVREGNAWHRVRSVEVNAPMVTAYRGPRAKQPRAYLAGRGRVQIVTDHAIVHA